jgi:hypothetical protein
MKEDEMDGEGKKGHSEDIGIDGRIILNGSYINRKGTRSGFL